MDKAKRRANFRRDRRNNCYRSVPIGYIVLDDQSRPRLLDFVTDGRVELREVDFAAPRE